MKKRILVKGPALSRSGYGEQTRFALRALRAHEERFDIFLHNLNWGRTSWIYDDNEERSWIDQLINKTGEWTKNNGTFDMSLQITIPNEWEKIAPINIGYTAGIETTRVAPVWIEKSQVVDKIITISEHSKQVYEKTAYEATNQETGEVISNFHCTTPIHVVHYPVRYPEITEVDINLDYDFNFLVVAQWSVRKNMENTVKWFLEEFKDEEVGMVVKANTASDTIADHGYTVAQLQAILSEFPERKCKVYLLHGTLTEGEMASLYKHEKIKALATLTHGEGFGLPIFEAAYSGLPVIAPDWSGQNDYLFMPVKEKKSKKIKMRPMFSRVAYTVAPVPPDAVWDGVIQKDSMWCNPTKESYKKRLREVYKAPGRHVSQAKKLQKFLIDNFVEKEQYKEFADLVLPEDQVVGEKDINKMFEEMFTNPNMTHPAYGM